MKDLQKGNKMNKKGFTLIELLVTVIIISILSSVAMPRYVATLEKARSAEAIVNVGGLKSSMERYWYEQISFERPYKPATLDSMDLGNPNFTVNRFYNYYFSDSSTKDVRSFAIVAKRIGREKVYWVKWIQRNTIFGKLYRSNLLGGPEEDKSTKL